MNSRKWLGWVAALVGALLTAGAWSLASPAGSSPDDNFHLGTIWCTSPWNSGVCQLEGPAQGAYGQSYYLVPPQAAFVGTDGSPAGPCYAFKSDASGECAEPDGWRRITINDGLYPPVFYAYAGLFATDSQNRTVVQVRLAVSLAAIVVLALAYARSLPWLRPAILVSCAVGLVPLGLSVIASTNPSSWAVAGLLAAWPVGVTVMLATSARQRWTAAALWLVAAVMAAGSRSDAAAYLAGITFITLVVLWRRSVWPARAVAAVILAASTAVLLSSGQTNNVTTGFLEQTQGRSLPVLVWQAVKGVPGLWIGATGAPGGAANSVAEQLGWSDVPVPPAVWAAMLMVIGALMLIGIAWLSWEKTVALALMIGVAVALPSYVLIANKAIPGELLQPRYLLPLVLVIFAVCLVRPASDPLSLTRVQAVVVVVLVAFAQALALNVYMRRFVTGIDVDGPNLDASLEWWWSSPISPNMVWLLGSVGWAAVMTVAGAHLRTRRLTTA